MDSWEAVKRDWDVNDDFPVPRERVIRALAYIDEEFGAEWFRKAKKSGLGKGLILLDAVFLGEAIAASEEAGASKLTRRLRLNPESREWLSEANVIRRLLPFSDKIEYEPKIEGMSKKPDILQHIQRHKIQYEVLCTDASAAEKERDKELHEFAQELHQVLESGSLDVYLLKLDIDANLKTQVLKAVESLNNVTDYVERELTDVAFLAFDPQGGITTDSEGFDGYLVHHEKDRRLYYKDKLGLKGSPGIIVFSKTDVAHDFCNIKLLRIDRLARDERILQKIIDYR